MNSSQKAYISFLMSVFLMSSIGVLAYIGVFDLKNFPAMSNYIKIIACVAVSFTLFLLFFFLFNIKRRSSREKKTVSVNQEENLYGASAPMAAGSVEVPAGVTRHKNGLLAAASRVFPPAGIDETPRRDIIYEENGVPYINSDLVKRNNQGTLNSNFIKLVESVTGSLPPSVLRYQDKPDKAHKGSQG